MLRPDEIILLKEEVQENAPNPKCCFSWTNYKGHMLDQIGELLRDEKFVDVTLYCENRSFKAHKLILCGASSFLKSLLEENPCPQPEITLSFVPWQHLTWILQFIYSGQVSVPEECFEEFLETAKLLQISTLAKKHSNKRPTTTYRPRLEIPAKRARLTSDSELHQESHHQQQPSDAAPAPLVFFRTQAVLQGLQRATEPQPEVRPTVEGGTQSFTIHLPQPMDSLEVQAEEVVEIEYTGDSADESQINQHGDYGSPISSITLPAPRPTSKQALVFDSRFKIHDCYQASTLKSSHSLAPKKCNMCNKVYSNLSNLRQHVSLVHTSHESTPCPLCGKLFKSDLYMRRHLICSHSVMPVKKDAWKPDASNPPGDSLETPNNPETVQQQIWSEMSAAAPTLSQNITS